MRCAVLLLFVVGCGSASPAHTAGGSHDAPPPAPEQVAIPVGYIEMKPAKVMVVGDSAALILIDEQLRIALPIFIGGTEGSSIDLRMRGQRPPRPLTHDLLDAALHALHASLVRVQVDELRGNTFHGSVWLRNAQGRVLRLDARPSDAIALAIGDHAPIYVAKHVLDAAGIDPDSLRQPQPQGPAPISS